jgi:hypothetical protein
MSVRKVWWVNQRWSYPAEMTAGVVFAGTDHDRTYPHHEVLAEMNPGDVTLHYAKKVLRAIGVVEAPAIHCRRPYPAEKRTLGLSVEVTYFELPVPIPIDDLPDDRLGAGPFDRNGRVKQGYCFPVTESWAAALRSARWWPRGHHGELLDGSESTRRLVRRFGALYLLSHQEKESQPQRCVTARHRKHLSQVTGNTS